MKAENAYFCWAVAYIDASLMSTAVEELNKYPEYKEIEVYIPTVKVLTKTFKGIQKFEEVPLLFNYGFFRIPRKFAIHSKFLEDLRNNVSCIFYWVKDPHKVIKNKPRLNLGPKSVYLDKEIPVATATSKEVAYLIKNTFNYSAHSSEDLGSVMPGAMITLRGYPFEGMTATILEINDKKKSVKVKLKIFDQVREVMVAYDNVFFTIYHNNNYDDSIGVKNSLNAMTEAGALDKQTFTNYKKNEG